VPARKGSTVRVRLARPEPEDAAELLALHRASRSFHRGRASPPVTAAQFRRYLARCERPDFVGLLIRRRSDDAILGAVELSQITRGGFQSAYLGYHVGAPFAGQGYMTESLLLAMRHAFRGLKLHRLEANIQPSNRASIALVKRLGFRREGYSRRYLKIAGRWRDHERWAVLKEDWTPGGKVLG
jgi:[ribosomal protein S5]-alanine N-acetyltransferase